MTREHAAAPARLTPNSRRSRMPRTSAASMARPSLRSSQSSGRSMGGGRRDFLLPVGHAAHHADAGRELAQQFDGARQAADRIGRVLRLLEAHGSVGAQLDGRRRLADARRLEVGALQHHARGLFADGAVAAADHSGQRDGAGRIGDHQVRRNRACSLRRSARGSARRRGRGGRRWCRRASRSASKACMGCASSAMTKLVMSTMLLMGLSPMAVSRPAASSGEGRTVTFSKTSALYRGQRSRVFDGDFDGRRAVGQQIELARGP